MTGDPAAACLHDMFDAVLAESLECDAVKGGALSDPGAAAAGRFKGRMLDIADERRSSRLQASPAKEAILQQPLWLRIMRMGRMGNRS